MPFVREPKKGNRGHKLSWHKGEKEVKGPDGDVIVAEKVNCPCKGKPQEPSKQLQARLNGFESAKLENLRGFHRPGSQNRKKR